MSQLTALPGPVTSVKALVYIGVKALRNVFTLLAKVAGPAVLDSPRSRTFLRADETETWFGATSGPVTLLARVDSRPSVASEPGVHLHDYPFGRLKRLVSLVTCDRIGVELSEDNSVIGIDASGQKGGLSASFKLATTPDASAPAIPTQSAFPFSEAWGVDSSELIRAVDQCIPSIGKSSRYNTDGIFLECGDDAVTLIATDGAKISRSRLDASTEGFRPEKTMMIPSEALRALSAFLGCLDGAPARFAFEQQAAKHCGIDTQAHYIRFRADSLDLRIRLDADASLPKFTEEQVFPGGHIATITLHDIPAFTKAVKAASHDDSVQLTYDADQSRVTVSSGDGVSTDVFPGLGNLDGESFTRSFNAKSLLKYLKSQSKSERITIGITPFAERKMRSDGKKWDKFGPVSIMAENGAEYAIQPLDVEATADSPIVEADAPEVTPEPSVVEAAVTPVPVFSEPVEATEPEPVEALPEWVDHVRIARDGRVTDYKRIGGTWEPSGNAYARYMAFESQTAIEAMMRTGNPLILTPEPVSSTPEPEPVATEPRQWQAVKPGERIVCPDGSIIVVQGIHPCWDGISVKIQTPGRRDLLARMDAVFNVVIEPVEVTERTIVRSAACNAVEPVEATDKPLTPVQVSRSARKPKSDPIDHAVPHVVFRTERARVKGMSSADDLIDDANGSAQLKASLHAILKAYPEPNGPKRLNLAGKVHRFILRCVNGSPVSFPLPAPPEEIIVEAPDSAPEFSGRAIVADEILMGAIENYRSQGLVASVATLQDMGADERLAVMRFMGSMGLVWGPSGFDDQFHDFVKRCALGVPVSFQASDPAPEPDLDATDLDVIIDPDATVLDIPTVDPEPEPVPTPRGWDAIEADDVIPYGWDAIEADTPIASFLDVAPISGGAPLAEAPVEAEPLTPVCDFFAAYFASVQPEPAWNPPSEPIGPGEGPGSPVQASEPTDDESHDAIVASVKAKRYAAEMIAVEASIRDQVTDIIEASDPTLAGDRAYDGMSSEERMDFDAWLSFLGYCPGTGPRPARTIGLRWDNFIADCVYGQLIAEYPTPEPEGTDDEDDSEPSHAGTRDVYALDVRADHGAPLAGHFDAGPALLADPRGPRGALPPARDEARAGVLDTLIIVFGAVPLPYFWTDTTLTPACIFLEPAHDVLPDTHRSPVRHGRLSGGSDQDQDGIRAMEVGGASGIPAGGRGMPGGSRSPVTPVRLIIRDMPYEAEPLPDRPDVIRVTSQAGESYDVMREGGLVTCSCPQFVYRIRGLSSTTCKHGASVVEAGLLPDPADLLAQHGLMPIRGGSDEAEPQPRTPSMSSTNLPFAEIEQYEDGSPGPRSVSYSFVPFKYPGWDVEVKAGRNGIRLIIMESRPEGDMLAVFEAPQYILFASWDAIEAHLRYADPYPLELRLRDFVFLFLNGKGHPIDTSLPNV